MDNNSLQHYGVLGMKWGVRRSEAELGRVQKRVDKLKAKKQAQDRLERAKKKLAKAKAEESSLKTYLKKGKSKVESKSKDNTAPKKIALKDLSDDELRTRINRMNMEKQYIDMVGNKKRNNNGKSFVTGILEQSGRNIATQATTYAMGKLLNNMFKNMAGEDIVNPKKGQKDK